MTQLGIGFSSEVPYEGSTIIKKDVIVDRGSRYTFVVFPIERKEDIKVFLTSLKKDLFFSKATHNSYAWRLQGDTGVIDGKNDDGETGAGMCILREMIRAQRTNLCIVVTRYFGGIQLQSDRFKHVIDVTKMALEKINSL